jgi:hypothetical protein
MPEERYLSSSGVSKMRLGGGGIRVMGVFYEINLALS